MNKSITITVDLDETGREFTPREVAYEINLMLASKALETAQRLRAGAGVADIERAMMHAHNSGKIIITKE